MTILSFYIAVLDYSSYFQTEDQIHYYLSFMKDNMIPYLYKL